MEDKKIELISAKGAMGLPNSHSFISRIVPRRSPIKGCGYGYGLHVV